MSLSRRTLFAVAALLVATPTFAADEPAPYLTAKQLDLTIFLPLPPANGSDETKAELMATLATQKLANPERIKLAQADANETVFDMFTRTLGDKFSDKALSKDTVTFWTRVTDSEDDVTDVAKKFFGRVRPFQADPNIKPLAKASTSGSWPSGHTTRVTMSAIILAAMLPEKRDAIWARANEYAESRIIVGMHYPSDLDAGRRAGTAMATMMFTDPVFRADFEKAKADVRKTLGM